VDYFEIGQVTRPALESEDHGGSKPVTGTWTFGAIVWKAVMIVIALWLIIWMFRISGVNIL